MVILKDVLISCADILKACVPSPFMEAEIILGHIILKDSLYIKTHPDLTLTEETEKLAYSLCQRRAKGEPVAYITGTKEFMSLEFEVNSNVLIPRPDTEIITEYIIEKYRNRAPKILDLCTGSGAVAISLAKYIVNSQITATDISKDALEVAERNAKKHNVDQRIDFLVKDALKDYEFSDKFDIVVSNPPYIETSVISSLMKDVSEYEPKLALDGGEDGLIFYKKTVNNIRKILKPGGELVFEIGYNQGKSVSEIMEKDFSFVQVSKDFGNNDRMVTGQLR
ncbi:MAG: peptide chain release factor N(5)-glutamine methyltransferase [Clostridia bacterium]|nr:peptide chain release factor N(5)-glutamine methyltransferase [Clostridia bacterium]